jgi:hypothetical protein
MNSFHLQKADQKRDGLISLAVFTILIFALITFTFAAVKKVLVPDLPDFYMLSSGAVTTVLGCGLFLYKNSRAVTAVYKSSLAKVCFLVVGFIVFSECQTLVDNFMQEKSGLPPSALNHVSPYLMRYVLPAYWFVAGYAVTAVIYLLQTVYAINKGAEYPSFLNRYFVRELSIVLSLVILMYIVAPQIFARYTGYVSDDYLVNAMVEHGYVRADSICSGITKEERVLFVDLNTLSIASKGKDSTWHFRVGPCDRV